MPGLYRASVDRYASTEPSQTNGPGQFHGRVAEPEMSIETFVFPTSFAQRRLWFVHQLEPGSPSYNVTTALKLSGNLDQGALEHSLAHVIARHEALRTTFRVVDGEPVQV